MRNFGDNLIWNFKKAWTGVSMNRLSMANKHPYLIFYPKIKIAKNHFILDGISLIQPTGFISDGCRFALSLSHSVTLSKK